MSAPFIKTPSPNFDTRAHPISVLVLHYTDMPDYQTALDRLCDPQSKLSAHYLITASGVCHALVEESARAWHAGVAHWRGIDDVNSASVGIELDYAGESADGSLPHFAEAQIKTLIELAGGIVRRYQIAPHCVVGHSDIAPDRKTDPGAKFPWVKLAEQGIGLWVETPPQTLPDLPILARGDASPAVTELQRALARFGYGVAADGRFGAQTQAVVGAFQRHFRPSRIDGCADSETQFLLEALDKKISRV